MPKQDQSLTGIERTFADDELIVSKTNLKGWITYANDVFIRIGGYTETELLNQPHAILRHPEMPRCVFKLLWGRIAAGSEIFAYVVNRAKNGDHYWVFAHVTPTVAPNGEIVGYHSNRRSPRREAIAAVEPIYRTLRTIEQSAGNPKAGLQAATDHLSQLLKDQGASYDEFILSV